MSKRLNQERKMELQPIRIEAAKINIGLKLGFDILEVTDTFIKFEFQNEVITFYPYSGWHTGKSIKDGRGWKNLYHQLKQKKV